MADIIVKYNNTTLSPTPLVQQSRNFIDYGRRWGDVTDIELNGNITGITSPLTAQSGFAAIFTGQFGTLQVLDGTTSIYQWNNVVVDEISMPLNHLFIQSIAPYSVRMKSISVPSGVVEPVNEYSFTQSEDGTVLVVHKISARGIRTQNGGLANAITFVKSFTGQNPFSAPLGAVFCPTGSGVLMSFSESIDRTACTYNVQEVYKYSTGLSIPYVETWNVNTSDTIDNEWLTIDVDWTVQGSPVQNNIPAIETALLTNRPINKLSTIGYNTGNFVQAAASYSRNTGAATIQMRTSYVSGYSAADISGYLDYTVSFVNDIVIPKEEWRIEGDFVCLGPLEYRKTRLNAFKSSYSSDWEDYLTGLIINSPLYQYHNVLKSFGAAPTLEIHENTGLAQFRLALTVTDGGHTTNLWYPKYTVEVQPNKWTYDMLPSANIEGHYVLQDLQMMTQGKIGLSIQASVKNTSLALAEAVSTMSTLANLYVTTGFLTAESYNTGLLELSYNQEWLGVDKINSGLLYTKVAGSTLNNYLRPPNYLFGY